MVPIVMGVLVGVHHGLVAVLVPVMGVGTRLVAVLMLMLVLGVTAHLGLTSFFRLLTKILRNICVTVKRNLGQSRGQG
jgi:nitrate/nitrite transporter NarK